MKLIDAPIGIFRFDGELVLKTEYKSENKLSGKYIPDCYIVRTGEYFWGGAKTANELNNLDVEPVDFAELLPTVTDTISRQAAIEALGEKPVAWSKGEYERGLQNQWGYDVSAIKQLQSAQPEYIKGHWICDRSWSEGVGMGESYGHYWKCDKCGHLEQGDWGECGCNFCSNCGSDNREVTT